MVFEFFFFFESFLLLLFSCHSFQARHQSNVFERGKGGKSFGWGTKISGGGGTFCKPNRRFIKNNNLSTLSPLEAHSLNLSCCFIEERLWWLVFEQMLTGALVLIQNFILAWGAQAVIWRARP